MAKSKLKEKGDSIKTAELLKNSVASVGTFKPKFNPQNGKLFSDELEIYGTAFWVTEQNILITCAHVIANTFNSPIEQSGLLVIGYQGKFYRVEIGTIDYQHDLATLRLIDPIPDRNFDGLSISKKYPKVSNKVSWAGYPLGNLLLNQIHDPTYSEGVIGIEKRDESYRKTIQISGTVVGGYSGSPVILIETAEVVGVISNGPQNAGIFMSISFEHVQAITELSMS